MFQSCNGTWAEPMVFDCTRLYMALLVLLLLNTLPSKPIQKSSRKLDPVAGIQSVPVDLELSSSSQPLTCKSMSSS